MGLSCSLYHVSAAKPASAAVAHVRAVALADWMSCPRACVGSTVRPAAGVCDVWLPWGMATTAVQVTGEGHIFSASTADERLLAAVSELELDKQGSVLSSRAFKGVVPGTLVTPEPTAQVHNWQ